MIVESIRVGLIDTNCYFVVLNTDNDLLIIDPGDDSQKIIKLIESNNWQPAAIFATHGHYDHIGAISDLCKEYGVPVFMNDSDSQLKAEMNSVFGVRDFETSNQSVLDILNKYNFQLLETPGHSPGSTCLYNDSYFFAGDTIFAGGFLGRTDLYGGDPEQLSASVRNIFQTIKTDLKLYPGHGPKSSITTERAYHAG